MTSSCRLAPGVSKRKPSIQNENGFVRRGETESVGRQSARRILAIRATPPEDLTDADYAHMKKVIGYCRRHLAQRPWGDVTDTRWRWSLMNWGHDPVKEDER